MSNLLGDLTGNFLGNKEEEGEEKSNLMDMAEKGLGAIGMTKEAAIDKAANMVESATGIDVDGMLGKFGIGGGANENNQSAENSEE